MPNFDYSQTMMMKIALSIPDNKGGSKVFFTFEQAFEIIKKIDKFTCGCPKILYLVGWQYNGHDDKYPAFFEVNAKLKRETDKNAIDSLLWLIDESKKYNTTVSLHINLTDAYPDSPLWQEYIENDLILSDRKNQPKVTGVWNNRKAYQVRYQKEVESGYFYKRVDSLLKLIPNLSTIHIDAYFVRKGKDTTITKEKAARLAMIEYFNKNCIDVTSEFIYRERSNGFRAHFGYSDTIGVIPAFWNPVYSRKDILKYPASVLAGGKHCKSLTLDKSIEWLIYGNMQAEELFGKPNWEQNFIKEFATYNVPYFYLNANKRLKITGLYSNRKLYHQNGIVSMIKNKRITKNGIIIKDKNEVFLPLLWRKNSFILYTENGGNKTYDLVAGRVDIKRVNFSQTLEKINYNFSNNKLYIETQPNQCYLIQTN